MPARPFAALLLLLAATSWMGAAWAGPVLERVASNRRIVLAHRESSVPFSHVEQGKPAGCAMDLCRHVADVVRADGTVTDLAGVEGLKRVSTEGTTPLKAVQSANSKRLLRINVLEVPDHARGVEMVEKNEADGFVMDDVLLDGLRASRADPGKLKVVGQFLDIEPLAILLSKDDPEFKRLVDDEMKRLIRSREAHALSERWFLKPIAPRNTALDLPMSCLLKDLEVPHRPGAVLRA